MRKSSLGPSAVKSIRCVPAYGPNACSSSESGLMATAAASRRALLPLDVGERVDEDLAVLGAGEGARHELEERLEELQVVPARARDVLAEGAVPGRAGELAPDDVQDVREARLQAGLRVEHVALVVERHLDEVPRVAGELRAAQEVLERAGEPDDLAPRAERDDARLDAAALDLGEDDRLLLRALREGVLEERAGVPETGADLLRRVQVPERHVVEAVEGLGRDRARGADDDGPLAVRRLRGALHEGVGDEH